METASSRPMGPYKSAQRLKDCELEKEALERQVEELKTQLQGAGSQEYRDHQQLSAEVERQTTQIKTLQRQVEELKNKLLAEKANNSGCFRELDESSGGDALQDEVRRLNDLLGQERATNFQELSVRLQLSKDLDRAREQAARHKSLKEMSINREKETRAELERLKRLSEADATETARMAGEILARNVKRKQKKELLRDLEELRYAHAVGAEKFSARLREERDRSECLRRELERLKLSHDADVKRASGLKAEVERLEGLSGVLQKQVEADGEVLAEKLELIEQLKAKNFPRLQESDEEMETLRAHLAETKQGCMDQLQGMRADLDDQMAKNHKMAAKLCAEQKARKELQIELQKLKEQEQKDVLSVENEKAKEQTPSIICRMLTCWRSSKAPRKNLRRKKRSGHQPGTFTDMELDLEEEEEDDDEAESEIKLRFYK